MANVAQHLTLTICHACMLLLSPTFSPSQSILYSVHHMTQFSDLFDSYYYIRSQKYHYINFFLQQFIQNLITHTHFLARTHKNSNQRQLSKFALSKGPNRVGVSFPSPEDSNRSSFRNVVSSIYNSGQWIKS
jgi:hypothetical protein